MLVLTRKLQQQIKIGDQITVTVLRIKGNTVRVGVQAPREVRVVRGELPKDAAASGTAPQTETLVEEAELSMDVSSDAVPTTACEPVEPAAGIAAAHLPLRRIRNRHGAGPLKQVVASCATLAK